MGTLSSNSRIAKNTILLYGRMIISLIITLYTSRAILAILGENDYGIYNVVGGVVVLFSFLTNSMTNSTQRFLNYTLGLDDKRQLENVFNSSIFAHLTILIIVFVLAETIGLWFVKTKLNIPIDRQEAAMWVYQTSIIASLLNIIVIPYRASIIATEKMEVFAYISILDVVLKLIIVFVLPYFALDRLVLYTVLLAVISLLNFILYRSICRNKYQFTHFQWIWDKSQYFKQMSFSGWYLFGGIATVGAKQGTNILINIFYNVAVNAAVGVANQVRNAVFGFVSSFQTAFNPQIVKLYASGDNDALNKLVFRSSKFSYFLLYVIALPIIVFCEEILGLWLETVPEYAISFTQLVIIASFTEALSSPLWTAIGATGNINRYQFWVSMIILLDIPLVYIFLKLGYTPIYAFYINLIVSIIAYIFRVIYIKKYIGYSLRGYFLQVLVPCILVTSFSVFIPIILKQYIYSLASLLLIIIITIILTTLSVYIIGMNKKERMFILSNVLNFSKLKH